MKIFSIVGILVGVVALIVLDTLGGLLLTKGFIGELTKEAAKEIQSDTLFLVLRMFVGAFALVGAGYIVEKIAKKEDLINSGILGVISVALTVWALDTSYPIWYLVLSYLYQWPSAIAGGYIFKRTTNQK